jgi:predicted neuraminidase
MNSLPHWMLLICLAGLASSAFPAAPPALLKAEFIYETAPFPQCHASTIAETKNGLVSAWFGGKHEKNPDVGIWFSRHENGKWSPPIEVANGIQHSVKRYPCWNPVLFQPRDGPLLLFYKVGPNPDSWWGMLMTSPDAGRSWSESRRLPEGIIGPVKNKPVQLSKGELLCPSSTEDDGWRVHFERTSDLGKTWEIIGPVNDGKSIGAIQPSILFHPDGKLQALGRTRQNRVFETWSEDNGKTWSPMVLGSLPNPNSGTDAVTLKDGRYLIVYNHVPGTPGQWGGKRSPLNVALSRDGKTWEAALILEDEAGKEFSYPAVIQSSDGLVHITYTWKRQRVKHAVLDPRQLQSTLMPEGEWPK